MSRIERLVWMWTLGLFTAMAVLYVVLPQWLLVVLWMLMVGWVIMFSTPIVVGLVCMLGVNLALWKCPFWLRWAIGAVAAVGLVAGVPELLNQPRRQAYERLVAQDTVIAKRPVLHRLALVDDQASSEDEAACGTLCGIYLFNRQVDAVLVPLKGQAAVALQDKTYVIYRLKSVCQPATIDLYAISHDMPGFCGAEVGKGAISPGDVVVRHNRKPPSLSDGVDMRDQADIFLMEASGLRKIARQTAFKVSGVVAPPFIWRDINMWRSEDGRSAHWTVPEWIHDGGYPDILKTDLGLYNEPHRAL